MRKQYTLTDKQIETVLRPLLKGTPKQDGSFEEPHRYIYVRKGFGGVPKGKVFANVHLLLGYCPQTIPEYLRMIALLRKDFPQAKLKDIDCTIVTESRVHRRFTLIAWSGVIPNRSAQFKAWHWTTSSPEYHYA